MNTKILRNIKWILVVVFALCMVSGIGLALNGRMAYAQTETLKTDQITMQKGASIRMEDPSGIRFTAEVNESLIDTTGETTTFRQETGIIIVPDYTISDLWNGSSWTQDIFGHLLTTYEKAKEMVSVQLTEENISFKDGKYLIRGAIVNIKETHYHWNYMAVCYIHDGTGYKYSAPSDIRSIAEVAHNALNDVNSTFTDEQKAMLNAIIEKAGPKPFTPSDPMTYIKAGATFTYNTAEKCYERDYKIGEKWGETTKFTITKEYINHLKSEGISRLTVKLTGDPAISMSKHDAGGAYFPGNYKLTNVQKGYFTFNLDNLNDLPRGVTSDNLINADGSITFKIYNSSSNAHVKLFLQHFDPSAPETYIDIINLEDYDPLTKGYKIGFTGGGYKTDDSRFVIKKEYIQYLVDNGVTKLNVRMTCDSLTGNLADDTDGAKDLSPRKKDVELNTPFDIVNKENNPANVVDEYGNFVLRPYATNSDKLTVYLLPEFDPYVNTEDPATYISSDTLVAYHTEDGAYEINYITYQGGQGKFTIKKEYFEMLKKNGYTKLNIRVTGNGKVGIGDNTDGANDIGNRGGEVSLLDKYVINLATYETDYKGFEKNDGKLNIVNKGSFTIRPYSSEKTILKVYLEPSKG